MVVYKLQIVRYVTDGIGQGLSRARRQLLFQLKALCLDMSDSLRTNTSSVLARYRFARCSAIGTLHMFML